MAHESSEDFRVHHALRIKGFATLDVISEISMVDESSATAHLSTLQNDGHAMFREARSLWQLTPTGKELHLARLAADVTDSVRSGLAASYDDFLSVNEKFKELCGAWQLRDGAPNDHSDIAYDKQVIGELAALHAVADPLVKTFGAVLARMSQYAPRLHRSREAVEAGQHNMFTGVMCGSFHDIWMELHEDLILSQGIDRSAEGSF